MRHLVKPHSDRHADVTEELFTAYGIVGMLRLNVASV